MAQVEKKTYVIIHQNQNTYEIVHFTTATESKVEVDAANFYESVF